MSVQGPGTEMDASGQGSRRTLRGIGLFDELLDRSDPRPPWSVVSGDGAAAADNRSARRQYVPDLPLLQRIIAVPAGQGAASQSGLLGKGVDAWVAHEFRRAGFEPDAVWPRATSPRVLPADVVATHKVPADLGAGPFMEEMIRAVLEAAPATAHTQVRDLRRGFEVEPVPEGPGQAVAQPFLVP